MYSPAALSSAIWSAHVWLPENTTWTDFRSTDTIKYPEFSEMSYAVGAGAALLVIRLLVECFIYLPIGYAFGWINTEKGLCSRIVSHFNFGFMAHQSRFRKIAETAWRFTFYTLIWGAGLVILSKQPQFYNSDECWRDWPYHPIPTDVWYYFIIETGFYWSLLFSTFVIDVRRSDFWQMMLHHFITILLLSICWALNFVRVGSLILLCHDTADILLEIGKLFKYAKWNTATTVIFVVFLFTWIGTRLLYFPMYIIEPMLTRAPAFIQKSYRWENILQRPIMPRVVFAMLCILLILHVFWTYLLLKIAIKSLSSGIDDIREDSDDESDEESPSAKAKKTD